MDRNPEHSPKSGQKGNKTELEQVGTREMKPRVTRLRLYEAFAALCFIVAGFFLGLNFIGFNLQWLAISATAFFLVGLVLSGFALRLWLLNNHRTKKKANGWFCVVVVPSMACCSFLFWWEWRQETLTFPARTSSELPAPAKPHLKLIITTPSHPNFRLELTNAQFFVDPQKQLFAAKMMLLFPVASSDSLVTLRLLVDNDSTEITEGFQLRVIFPDRLDCTMGSGWENQEAAWPGTRAISYSDDKLKLYPYSGAKITDIAFKRIGGWTNPPDGTLWIVLGVETKGMPLSAAAFRLDCPILQTTNQPRLVLPNEVYWYR